MLLQTGPRFVVPFAFTAGVGLLLVLAGGIGYARFGDGGDGFGPLVYRAGSLSLVLFGLGLVAVALDFAGTMADILTDLQRPDGTPMEPSLLGTLGRVAPWELLAGGLFVAGAVAAVVAVAGVVRAEFDG